MKEKIYPSLRDALLTLGIVLLIMGPILLVDRYNVSKGANMALWKYHYYMIAEGIPLPRNDRYSITFTEFENHNQIAIARGMFKPKEVEIYISKSWWMKLGENDRNILLYHELSHDLLQITHQWCDDKSLMFPNKSGMIKKDADEMVKDLLRQYKKDSLRCGPRIRFNIFCTDHLRIGDTIFLDEVIIDRNLDE